MSSVLIQGRLTSRPGNETLLVTINYQPKSEDAMDAALLITLIFLIRLVIPLGLLLVLGTAINRRQAQIL